eukprot:CAMPEP_0118646478 /NCGR_PEP_ID=MMETSP0785-20121206/8078_1 /TAXON_ID=91992 /ORGANISM="Bolidomonas pacifica, Strain CCMP 1866" /LENGTH=600 /DNA_ID=CAMNT_0006538475 /DNA_START=20 /DNA_END=1819 /DNA_ORIENTATION=-
MEEDVELWYCVHVSGRVFAEISKTVMTHFDRYDIRKRFMVLERRRKVAEKNEASIEGDVKEGGKGKDTKLNKKDSGTVAANAVSQKPRSGSSRDIKKSVEMAGEKVKMELERKKGKPGVNSVVPIASGGVGQGGGSNGIYNSSNNNNIGMPNLTQQQQQQFMANMISNMMQNNPQMMQMMMMMMMSGGMGGGVAMGGEGNENANANVNANNMNPMMAMMMGMNSSNSSSNNGGGNNGGGGVGNNAQQSQAATMMQMMMGGGNNFNMDGSTNQQQTEDALMPPPRSRANSIDLPASDTSMTTEEKGKKKRKATKATASAKNNKKKTKATSKGASKGALKGSSKGASKTTSKAAPKCSTKEKQSKAPSSPTPVANSDPSLMGYSPSLFAGPPSTSSMSGTGTNQSFQSLMNLDAENSIMAMSGANNNVNNNKNDGGNGNNNGYSRNGRVPAAAPYLPGKNLLGQVLDNANRSNSNSNHDAQPATSNNTDGSESNSWGGFENFDDNNLELSRIEFSETTRAAFADGNNNGRGGGSKSGMAEHGQASSLLNSPGLVMTPGGGVGPKAPLSDEMASDAVSGLNMLSTPKKKGKRSLFDSVVKNDS